MALPECCPLCSSDRSSQTAVTAHVYGGKEGQAFFRCLECDARYLHPGLTDEEESRFYAMEFEGFMAGRAGTGGGWRNAEEHVEASETTRVRRMAYLEPVLPAQARVLEVGCSSGYMLYPLVAQGHHCVGVEPSGVFSDFVEERGVPVYPSVELMLQDGTHDGGFDLIMHFFVLEHVRNPVEFLKQQLDLLASGGRLIFEVPNVADPLHSVYDIPAFERFYWSVAHAWYFSDRSLEHLLGRLNVDFEIRGDQRYDLSNHMVWARDGRPGGMGRFSGLLGQELEDSYRSALVRSGHCDTLICVAHAT